MENPNIIYADSEILDTVLISDAMHRFRQEVREIPAEELTNPRPHYEVAVRDSDHKN